jgi:hypothetical protein
VVGIDQGRDRTLPIGIRPQGVYAADVTGARLRLLQFGSISPADSYIQIARHFHLSLRAKTKSQKQNRVLVQKIYGNFPKSGL